MKSQEDAFGQQLYDFFMGERFNDVIERDDGFIDVTLGPEIYFAEFDDWRPEEKEAMRYVSGRVLDIGCGAGRHALYLQDQGLDVLGIDISPLAVYVSQRRGLRSAKVCSITQVSSKLGEFDTIIMMGNNFGLMANPKRARWLLRRFYALTPATGRIIASTNDPYQTSDDHHLAYHALNRQRGRMAGQLRIRFRYRKLKGAWFDYLMVSKEELASILIGTGWQVKGYIDSPQALYIAIIEKED